VTDQWLRPFTDKTLTHLCLAFCNAITDAGLLNLTELGGLQVADLTACAGLRTGGLAAFRESWSMTSLTLNGCRNLTDEAVKPLAYLSALQHLRLRGCWQLSDAALNALAPLMPQLKTLDVNACRQFSSTSISFCVGKMREIRHLDLGYCPRGVGGGALEVLTRGPAPTTLQVLILDSSRSLSNADLFSLGKFRCLQHLSLRNCSTISDAGLCQLPSSLETLDASHCRGVRRLPAQSLPCLRSVNFAHSGLRDSDVGSLAVFPALVNINLDSCSIGKCK